MIKKFALFLMFLSFLLFPSNLFASSQKKSPPARSFAQFAYFIEKFELPMHIKGQIWADPDSVYQGPFFIDSPLKIYLPPHYFSYYPQPFFQGPVFSSAPKVLYYKGYGPFNKLGMVDKKKFKMIFQNSLKLGVKPIPYPAHPEEKVRKAAFGTYPQTLSHSFVILPHLKSRKLTGGIVVAKSLKTLIFSAPSSHEFRLVLIGRKKQKALVQISFKKNETFLKYPSKKVEIFHGIPDGAIYIEGGIGSKNQGGIGGVTRGRWTLAAEKNIYISGNLEYWDTPAGSQPQGKDTLALIAPQIFITNQAPNILFLYATILSKMLFVLPSRDRNMARKGELYWWGNYIGEYPAIMGTFNERTGLAKDGYDLMKYYDTRLTKNPPPDFPTFHGTNFQGINNI